MFHGSMVALVTPMRADGVVDDTALRDLVEWHIAEGTHALVAVGTTGESATLEMREHVAVLRTVVEQVKGRIPVIAGTGANATYEAIELTRAAMEVKADAALLVSPYYNKPTQALGQGPRRPIPHHTLHRDHLQTAHQAFSRIEAADKMGRHTLTLQILHDEGVERIVYLTFMG